MSSLMPLQQALEKAQGELQIKVAQETINLSQALNRVLAKDVIAPLDVPPAANSAMDGYAINTADFEQSKQPLLKVSQRITAGDPTEPLKPGTCARIFTGAELPLGANAVVMQEDTQLEEEAVRFLATPSHGENVRPAGQDIQQGSTILRRGKRLSPVDLGVIASVGITTVEVYQPLKVGILTTGDELVTPGQPLKAGQIYNSNGPLLEALIQTAGHQVSLHKHAEDSIESTEQALLELSQVADVIISTGGVSVGDEDHVKATIEKHGQLHLWKIAIKPGKPLVFAKVMETPFIGLPGNPSSTLVTFHLFARLTLAKAAGEHLCFPTGYSVQCGFSRKANQSRDEFLRVTLHEGVAKPHPQQSSGALLAASQSDGYLHVPAGQAPTPGSELLFYPFSGF
ncbi:gephyrin-like molybdotransferase Glp [Rhodanobacter aciditrophus]|uniref:Molybdopterin molybdenumtransferase n=1 Tax=Rhodanobacter aciditrophus TaxID=1623218 RepID=A0ABW4B1T9_9GAMM